MGVTHFREREQLGQRETAKETGRPTSYKIVRRVLDGYIYSISCLPSQI